MPDNKKNKKNFEHIGNILNRFLSSYKNEFYDDLQNLNISWKTIVGDMTAKNSKPVAFKGKTLLVHVTGSSWIHNLQFMKKNIIDKINSSMKKELVYDIKFTIGPIL